MRGPLPLAATACVALLFAMVDAEAARKEPRSGVGPCRQGTLALLRYLDEKQQAGGEYAHAYQVVDTCGPVRKRASSKPVSDPAACRELVLKMLEEIEENRMNRRAFVTVRNDFAGRCAPAPGIAPKAPS